MATAHPNSLILSTSVLRLLITLNLIMGAAIALLLIATFVAEGPVFHALGVPFALFSNRLFFGMRMIMLIGIAVVPIVHFVSKRLLLIITTVSTGNPFVVVNAQRLRAIAWSLLVLDLMHLFVGFIGSRISAAGLPLHLSWGFSFTRCLAVLMLFVLAQVFEEGARMRDELEGTV